MDELEKMIEEQCEGEHDEMLDVSEAMEKYGGSFVKALGVCLRKADMINLRKLKAAFPEYYEEYKKTAERDKVRK